MVVCRFFQGGYCRNGDACKFEHTAPSSNRQPNNQPNNQWNRFSSAGTQQASPFGGQQPAFGQSTFGTAASVFGTQPSPFGSAGTPFGTVASAATGNLTKQPTAADLSSIVQEDLFSHPNIYPFSCFSAEKFSLSWISQADISAEELRWCAYIDVKMHGALKEYPLFVSSMMEAQLNARKNIAHQIQQGVLNRGEIPRAVVGISLPWHGVSTPQLVQNNTNFGTSTTNTSLSASNAPQFSQGVMPNMSVAPPSSMYSAVASQVPPPSGTITIGTSDGVLSNEDKLAFAAENFEYGRIPESAPPPEYCR